MCAVSMISGHFQGQYPQVQDFPLAIFPDYSELIRKAKLYDEMMKQPDCPDPEKEVWMAQLDKHMKERYGLEPKT